MACFSYINYTLMKRSLQEVPLAAGLRTDSMGQDGAGNSSCRDPGEGDGAEPWRESGCKLEAGSAACHDGWCTECEGKRCPVDRHDQPSSHQCSR